MRRAHARTIVIATTVVFGGAVSAIAQAFMPPKGEATVSFLTSDALVRQHIFFLDGPQDRGHVRYQTSTIDTSFGILDKVAVSMAIPDVRAKYYGAFPHQRLPSDPDYRVSQDDGSYHSAFQDFRIDARYRLKHEGLVITPYLAFVQPSHSYEYFAHSGVGRDLQQLEIGSYFANTLDAVLPGTFVQARYGYALSRPILGVSHNQSKVDFEVGYFVTQSIRMFALGLGQVTHGGINLTLASRTTLPYDVWVHHDQIARDNYLDLGAGGAVDLNDSVALFVSAIHTVTGVNTHKIAYSVTLGLSVTVHKGTMTHADHGMMVGHSKSSSLKKCLCEP
jgi:hypothetical protein